MHLCISKMLVSAQYRPLLTVLRIGIKLFISSCHCPSVHGKAPPNSVFHVLTMTALAKETAVSPQNKLPSFFCLKMHF